MTTDMSTDGQAGDGQGWTPRAVSGGRTLLVPSTAPPPPEPAADRAPVHPDAPAPSPRRQRTPRPWTTWPPAVRIGVAGTCIVLFACWAVSANAIVDGAAAAGIPFALALLCPLIVDGEMAIGTLALVSIARRARWWTRIYLGVLILLSVAVSMAANMAHPWTGWLISQQQEMGSPWAYLASGVPSLWIALVVHQLVILWRHTRDSNQATVAEPVQAQPSTVAVERVPDAWTGVRSPDGCWWWDGVQWCPVTVSEPALASGPVSPLALAERSADTCPATTPAPSPMPRPLPADRSSEPGGEHPSTEVMGERQAALSAWLSEQADNGRDLTTISVSKASKETGIARTTILRWLDGAPLSTFRDEPGRAGRTGVVA